MIKRLLLLVGCLACCSSAHAVYFPAGIDWANPSQSRFILSVYLNTYGRAPQNREISNATRLLSPGDNSQTRLNLFKEVLETREYQQIFATQDKLWKVYRAADKNYNNGNGYWRYLAATSRPSGFSNWQRSESFSEPVATSMAHYYDTFCYQGTPCIVDPEIAYKRGNSEYATATQIAHACADESRWVSQFEWAANNGTTYPRGTDDTTLCMGQHYFKAVGAVLERYQCDPGYLNCKRDQARDVRGQRAGRDSNGKPTLFFADGARLVLTEYQPADAQNPSFNSINQDPLLVDSYRPGQHNCADPTVAGSEFRWRTSSGIAISNGIGSTTVCMDNFYYQIEGVNLKRFDCAAGFRDCRANPAKDIIAEKRQRVEGYPGLEFRDGSTLALIKRSVVNETNSQTTNNATAQSRPAQHKCSDANLRTSRFRWTRQNGTSSRPNGVVGRYICLDKSYYEIQGSTLRHYQCSENYWNCQANRRNDLIAVSETKDGGGNKTLVFANGDRLSLIRR